MRPSKEVDGAAIGAAIGGLIIWALYTYAIPNGDIPGAWYAVIDIVAPLLGAFVGGFLGNRMQNGASGPAPERPAGPKPVP